MSKQEEQPLEETTVASRVAELATFDLPRFRPAYFGVAVVTVYALGFIVVSLHTSRFGAASYDLFRARYAAAGVLLLMHSAFPVLTGAFFWREFMSLDSHKPPPFWRIAIPLVVSLSLGFFCWEGVLILTSVELHPHRPLEGVWFLLLAATTTVGILFARAHVLDQPRRASARHLIRLTGVLVGIAFSVRIFATQMFPVLDPGLGGGAGVAVILIGEPFDDPRIRAVFDTEVLLIDRSGLGLKVVVPDSAGELLGVEVPNSSVQGIVYRGPRALPPGPVLFMATRPDA